MQQGEGLYNCARREEEEEEKLKELVKYEKIHLHEN